MADKTVGTTEKAEAETSGKASASAKKKDVPDDFKFIVRMVNTDIAGELPVLLGLTKIRGIGLRSAQVISSLAEVDPSAQFGTLDDKVITKLEEIVTDYGDNVPDWMVNRRSDYESGDDLHQVAVDVDLNRRDDINRMKMIRCYKGIKHERGHKVRGQRTRSNGRTGLQVGVVRKKLVPGQTEKRAEK